VARSFVSGKIINFLAHLGGRPGDVDEFLLPDTCRAMYLLIALGISNAVMRGVNKFEVRSAAGFGGRLLFSDVHFHLLLAS
jgi:hypothetical protein